MPLSLHSALWRVPRVAGLVTSRMRLAQMVAWVLPIPEQFIAILVDLGESIGPHLGINGPPFGHNRKCGQIVKTIQQHAFSPIELWGGIFERF